MPAHLISCIVTAMLRRTVVLGGLTASLLPSLPSRAADLLPMPALDAKGFYLAEWQRPTTGDVSQDLARATAEGKVLAMFWEMSPCPYCTQMHAALRDPALRALAGDGMYSVRYDKLGARDVVDFNGVPRTEREIGLAHKVIGSPTIVFRTADKRDVGRVPGYVNPKFLQAALEFATEGAYKDRTIAAWLRAKGVL
ncbi:MAG: hypothetical protein FJX64_01450 [Alphaproteobacteria bacterium]|nr:hypothetical protein [Alphaproteobacteria bacterium]